MEEGGEEGTHSVRPGTTGRGDVKEVQQRSSNAEVDNWDGVNHGTKVPRECVI